MQLLYYLSCLLVILTGVSKAELSVASSQCQYVKKTCERHVETIEDYACDKVECQETESIVPAKCAEMKPNDIMEHCNTEVCNLIPLSCFDQKDEIERYPCKIPQTTEECASKKCTKKTRQLHTEPCRKGEFIDDCQKVPVKVLDWCDKSEIVKPALAKCKLSWLLNKCDITCDREVSKRFIYSCRSCADLYGAELTDCVAENERNKQNSRVTTDGGESAVITEGYCSEIRTSIEKGPCNRAKCVEISDPDCLEVTTTTRVPCFKEEEKIQCQKRFKLVDSICSKWTLNEKSVPCQENDGEQDSHPCKRTTEMVPGFCTRKVKAKRNKECEVNDEVIRECKKARECENSTVKQLDCSKTVKNDICKPFPSICTRPISHKELYDCSETICPHMEKSYHTDQPIPAKENRSIVEEDNTQELFLTEEIIETFNDSYFSSEAVNTHEPVHSNRGAPTKSDNESIGSVEDDYVITTEKANFDNITSTYEENIFDTEEQMFLS